MTTLAVMAFLIGVYGAASFYVRRAIHYLELSSAPWSRLHVAAKEAISDPNMPQGPAAFAAAAVLCAGCGCITRQILFDALTGRLGYRRSANASEQMTPEQRAMISRVAINAIYYDSLRAPFSGFLLRRLVMPWLKSASESTSEKPKERVAQFVASSKKAIAHRPEGKKILAMI